MFYSEEEMKVAEKLAWEMLDGWNHAYMPSIDNYPHFYYKGKLILDPWMNEEAQDLPWPDHESAESVVDPVEYYGERTIEDYVTRLFLIRLEEDNPTVARIKENIDEEERLIKPESTEKFAVYVAMSNSQAAEEHCFTCIGEPLPDSERIYSEITKLPEELVYVKKDGAEKEIRFHKKDAKEIMRILYPNESYKGYKKMMNRVWGKDARLLGFGE